MTQLSPRTTIALASDQISCDVSGEVVILSLQDGIYYGLNPVGAAVWEMLAEPTSIERLRDGILERYDVGAERCERDLIALVDDLIRHDLVRVVSDDGPA